MGNKDILQWFTSYSLPEKGNKFYEKIKSEKEEYNFITDFSRKLYDNEL
jgi:hypothetical protein